MTKFTINKGRDNEVKVDADTTQVSDGWVKFYDEDMEVVYATPAQYVVSVEKDGVAS